MGGIHFCECGCQSEDLFVCFGAKPTQKAGERDFPQDRKRTREGRSQREQKKPVNRRGQNRAVSRREQATARTCGRRGRVGQHERISLRSWWLCENFAQIHAHASSADGTENCTKVSQNSPFLRLELTQVRVCLFSFLPPSQLCMLCFMCP